MTRIRWTLGGVVDKPFKALSHGSWARPSNCSMAPMSFWISVSIHQSEYRRLWQDIAICTQVFDMLSQLSTKHDSSCCMLYSHFMTVVREMHLQWFKGEKRASWCWMAKLVEKSVKLRVFAKAKLGFNETQLWAINLWGHVKILKKCIAVCINDRAQQSKIITLHSSPGPDQAEVTFLGVFKPSKSIETCFKLFGWGAGYVS